MVGGAVHDGRGCAWWEGLCMVGGAVHDGRGFLFSIRLC